MKLAFMIIAHKNPKQIARLCTLLTSDGDSVFVHIDKDCAIEPFNDVLKDMPNVYIFHNIRVCWAGFSQIEATNTLIDGALAAGKFDYFMLLSGQCFPVRSLRWLKEKLNEAGNDYINYYPMPRDTFAKPMSKVDRYHFEWKGDRPFWLRLAGKVAWRWPRRNVVKSLGLWPHAGSQWWCLGLESITFIKGFRHRRPDFDRYMRTVLSPDEIYYQSMLSASHYPERFKPALFWTEFSKETDHPVIYKAEDFDRLKSKNVFLIRKVDETIDPDLLSKLEESFWKDQSELR